MRKESGVEMSIEALALSGSWRLLYAKSARQNPRDAAVCLLLPKPRRSHPTHAGPTSERGLMLLQRCLLRVVLAVCVLSTQQLLLTAAEKIIPPPGIAVPEAKRAALQKQLDVLGAEIAALERSPESSVRELLPDVVIFWKAVHTALRRSRVL